MCVPAMMSKHVSTSMVKRLRDDSKGSVLTTGSHKTNAVTQLCTGYIKLSRLQRVSGCQAL